MKKNISTKGFNLVELMVVVAIIGILSSVAVPRFATFQAAAKQTEAKQGLNGLFLTMQAYQVNYNEYPVVANQVPTDTGTLAAGNIGFSLAGNKQQYTYAFTSNLNGWSAIAVSLAKIANDKFDFQRINTNKWLCAPYNAVTQKPADAATGKSATGATAITQCPQSHADGSNRTLAPTVTDNIDTQ